MTETEVYEAKTLYPFQRNTVDTILSDLEKNGKNFNLLFQLPTGGGKTVIFSEIAREFIERTKEKVLILTHRIELSVQTSKQLKAIGVNNMVISSEVKTIKPGMVVGYEADYGINSLEVNKERLYFIAEDSPFLLCILELD